MTSAASRSRCASAQLASLLRAAKVGLQLNEHVDLPGEIVFRHACKLGFEGMSKRLGSRYRSGRSSETSLGIQDSLMSLSARRRDDVELINTLPDLEDIGTVIVGGGGWRSDGVGVSDGVGAVQSAISRQSWTKGFRAWCAFVSRTFSSSSSSLPEFSSSLAAIISLSQ